MSTNDASKRTNSLACERCRAQKLRCDWPSSGDASCERCSRKGVQCKKNPSRRVGRPPRARAARLGSRAFHLVEPGATSYLPPALWQDIDGRQPPWEESHTGLTPCPIDPAMTHSDMESPPLSADLSHEGDLMNFFAPDLSTEWMAWSSDASTSANSSDSASSNGSLEPPPERSQSSKKDEQKQREDTPEATGQPENGTSGSLTCDVASLTSCLFELVPSQQRRKGSNASDQPTPTATLRSILQHTQTLSNLAKKSQDRPPTETSPLAIDGPTKLLLLSCYAKIFQAYRQMFAEVYSALRSGANMTHLLYDLRVEDVILDGDDDLKILVLMQVATHKLNTLGVQLGVPEKHYVAVGSGSPLGTKPAQPRGRQQSPEETEPTLDAILSGSGSDRCVFWGEFKDHNRSMESAAAAFREELGLLRAQLGHRSRCRALPLGGFHG